MVLCASGAERRAVPAVAGFGRHRGHAHHLTPDTVDIKAIDALLPQTQCTRCGYPGCLPYAHGHCSGRAHQPVSAGRSRHDRGAGATAGARGTAAEPRAWRRGSRRGSPSSMKRAVSAARNACHPARWMPSSAPRVSCTPSRPSCVPAASCALRRVRWIASRMVAVTAESVPAGPPAPAVNRQRYEAHEARVQRRAAERAALLAARKQLARRCDTRDRHSAPRPGLQRRTSPDAVRAPARSQP